MSDSDESPKSKTEQARDLVAELRDVMQVVAGGTDPRVQKVLEKFDALLSPAA